MVCEEWELCVDGVWYHFDYIDTSDRAMLQNIIKENNLEIKVVPLWNSCNKTKELGFDKIVFVDPDNAYLIKLED